MGLLLMMSPLLLVCGEGFGVGGKWLSGIKRYS